MMRNSVNQPTNLYLEIKLTIGQIEWFIPDWDVHTFMYFYSPMNRPNTFFAAFGHASFINFKQT